MKKTAILLLISSFLFNSFVLADEGMWTFDNPPLKQWKERYNFTPTQEWLDNLRLASVKIGTASGSFVSPNGLIATNHHVASSQIAKLSTKEKDLLKDGFHARTQAEELKTPDAEASVLISYENVTEKVQSSVKTGASDREASTQRQATIAQIEKESADKTGLKSTVITLYNGGEYWLYRFKVYTDVRLVFAPEEQIAAFGGDYDNFTFPRHDLDVTFLRAYENGQPAKTPNYLKWSEKGAVNEEFVIASGNPGSTARLLTVSQLAYQRDIGNPLQEKVWTVRRDALENYGKHGTEQRRQASSGIRSLNNSLKRLKGQQEGLLNPRMFAKKETEEKDLKDNLAKKPDLEKLYIPAWQQIENAYKNLPSKANQLAFSNLMASRLSTMASQIVRYSEEIKKPNNQRLPEYRETRLDSFKISLFSSAPIYLEMEEASLLSWLEEARKTLGNNDPFIKAALGDAETSEVVKRAIRETKLTDVAARKALIEDPDSVAKSTDPMITLARRVEPIMRQLQVWNEENINSIETSAGEKIAKARFAVYGRTISPDANSNIRMAYGKIKGYDEDTTLVPFRTTFYGLYDRAESFAEMPPYDLTSRWREGRNKLNLSAALNFVYTADTIGGMSGSPVVNRNAEVVGLNFDSNLQKLSNRYWYIEEEEGSRAVAVDSAGILEALRKMYGADALVKELLAK